MNKTKGRMRRFALRLSSKAKKGGTNRFIRIYMNPDSEVQNPRYAGSNLAIIARVCLDRFFDPRKHVLRSSTSKSYEQRDLLLIRISTLELFESRRAQPDPRLRIQRQRLISIDRCGMWKYPADFRLSLFVYKLRESCGTNYAESRHRTI